MTALLPPSSSSERPNRCATRWPTWAPTAHEPVKLINGMRRSSTNAWARSVPASLNRKNKSGKPASRKAALHILIEAIEHSGVFGDGFQMVISPHTADRNGFQHQTKRKSVR